MAATYPGAITPLPQPASRLTGPTSHSDHDKRISDELHATQVELGADPSGTYPDVADRLAALISLVDPTLLTALNTRYVTPGRWRHKQTQAFLRNITTSPRPRTILVMGDSTGTSVDRWFYLAMNTLWATHPEYTVQYRLWDGTNQSWGAETTPQIGAAGEAYFTASSTDTRQFNLASSAQLSPVGDISVQVRVREPNWTTTNDVELFSKWGGAGQRSWRFLLNNVIGAGAGGGKLYFEASQDGTAVKQWAASTAIVPFAPGQTGWVSAELDVDNGATGWTIKFYTSPDGVTWTQLGTPVTTAGVSSLFASTAALQLCNRGGSGHNDDYFAANLYSGIGAAKSLVAAWKAGDMFTSLTPAGTITGLDCSGNLWNGNSTALGGVTGAPALTVLNGSVSGQNLAYFTDATRFAKLTGSRIGMVFVNVSHNEATNVTGDLYRPAYLAFVDQIITALPDAAVIVSTQNPKAAPSGAQTIVTHSDRNAELVSLAAVRNLGMVDAYAALAADPTTDGTHPTSAGQVLWGNAVTAFLANA